MLITAITKQRTEGMRSGTPRLIKEVRHLDFHQKSASLKGVLVNKSNTICELDLPYVFHTGECAVRDLSARDLDLGQGVRYANVDATRIGDILREQFDVRTACRYTEDRAEYCVPLCAFTRISSRSHEGKGNFPHISAIGEQAVRQRIHAVSDHDLLKPRASRQTVPRDSGHAVRNDKRSQICAIPEGIFSDCGHTLSDLHGSQLGQAGKLHPSDSFPIDGNFVRNRILLAVMRNAPRLVFAIESIR